MKFAHLAAIFLLLTSGLALAQNPVPVIYQPLVPVTVAPGGPQFTLTVNGTGFVSDASVNWNGTALATTFVSGSQLTATVPAANIVHVGSASVTVTNPSPGGGTSNVQYLGVTNPVARMGFAAPVSYTGSLLTVVDVNGDGKPDMVVADGSQVGVLLGNGDGTFQSVIDSATIPFPLLGWATGDVNGDGKLDLICLGSSAVAVFLGNGDGTFQAPVTYDTDPAPFGSDAVTLGDLRGIGKLDLVVTNDCPDLENPDCSSQTLSVLLGNGDGTFQPAVNYNSAGYDGGVTAVVDINGDGKLDLVSLGSCAIGDKNGYSWEPCLSSSSSIGVLLGNGDGTFQPVVTTDPIGYNAEPLVLADVNGDGKLDLLTINGCVYPHLCEAGTIAAPVPAVLLGNGDGTFQTPMNYSNLNPQSSGLVLADMNGDGKLDMVVSWGIMLGNGDGTFQSPLSLTRGADFALDVNGDGLPDLFYGASVSLSGVTPTTKTALSSSENPSVLGQSLTLTATVTSPAQGTPTGTVTFSDGATQLGSSSLNSSAVAALSVSTLAEGMHSITASYSGDATFLASTSPVLSQVVRGTTTTTLASSPNPSLFDQSVNLAATVTPQGSGIPTGTVAFLDGATNLGSAPLKGNAVAVFSISTLAIGSHSLSASYNGDTNFGPSTSAVVNQTVSPFAIATLSPQSVAFPGQYVGTSGLPQTVTLTNTGTATLTITKVTASPADFGVLSACENSVAAGESCSIGVFFDPTAAGTRNGTLTVVDNAPGSPQVVTLIGVGQDFSMSSSSSSSATVAPGQTANYRLTIAPGGGFKQSVSFICSGAPADSTCSVTPASVTLSGSKSVAVDVAVATQSSAMGFSQPADRPFGSGVWAWAAWFGVLGMVVLGGGHRHRRTWRPQWLYGLAFLCLFAVAFMPACGGSSSTSGGGSGTPAGTYNLTVTGTFTSGSTTLTHTTKLTLVVQ